MAKQPQQNPNSVPALHRTVTLYSRGAQDIFTRYYPTTAYNLIFIGIVARLRGEHEIASTVEEEFAGWLKEASEKLKGEKERLVTALEDAGIDTAAVSYSAPREFEVRITSPQAGQFFGLIQELDEVLQIIDALWLHGEVGNDARVQLMQHWRRSIRKVAERFRHTANASRKRMNSEESRTATQEAEAQSGIAESEADSADEAEESETDDSESAPATAQA